MYNVSLKDISICGEFMGYKSKFAGDAAGILIGVGLGSITTFGVMSKPGNAISASDRNTHTYYMGTFTPPPADVPRAEPDLVVIPADSQEHAAWMVGHKLQSIEQAPRGNFYGQTIVMLQRDPKTGSMTPVDSKTYEESLTRARKLLEAGKSLTK